MLTSTVSSINTGCSELYVNTQGNYTCPPEILRKIFCYLPLSDFKNAQLVCRQWSEMGADQLLWAKLLTRDYPCQLFLPTRLSAQQLYKKAILVNSAMVTQRLPCATELASLNGAISPNGATIIEDAKKKGILKISHLTSQKSVLIPSGIPSFPDISNVVQRLFSRDGQKMVTVYGNGVGVRNAVSGSLESVILMQSVHLQLTSVELSPDNKTLLTCDSSRYRLLWDTTVFLSRQLKGFGHLTAAIFSNDGRRLLCADMGDCSIQLKDLASENVLLNFEKAGGDKQVMAAAFSVDDKKIIVSFVDGTSNLWDATSGELLTSISHPSTYGYPQIFTSAFSPDGRQIIFANHFGISIFDAQTGLILKGMKVNKIRHPVIKLSNDGDKWLISYPFAHAVDILDLEKVEIPFYERCYAGSMHMIRLNWPKKVMAMAAAGISGVFFFSEREGRQIIQRLFKFLCTAIMVVAAGKILSQNVRRRLI